MEKAVETSILNMNSFLKKIVIILISYFFWMIETGWKYFEVECKFPSEALYRMTCSCRVGGSFTAAALTLFLLLRGRNLEASSSSSSLEATKRGRLHYHSSAKLESRHFLVICIHEFLCLGTRSIAELQLLFFSVLSVVDVLLVVVVLKIISYI